MKPSVAKLVAGTVLAPHTAILDQSLTPGVGFALDRHRSTVLGESRLGGLPDAPADFVTPVFKNRPLDLLLQLNLREIPRVGLAAELPKDGLLSFFYDLKEQPWGFDPAERDGFRVCYFPQTDRLIEASGAMSKEALNPASMIFWPNWSLPDPETVEGEQMFRRISSDGASSDISAEFIDQYDALRIQLGELNAPAQNSTIHQIGGSPNSIQGDMQLEAKMVSIKINCGNATGYSDPRVKTLKATRGDWQLLLQLDSDEENHEFMWEIVADCISGSENRTL